MTIAPMMNAMGKNGPASFGDLPGQSKDPCPDHHARAHGNRAAQSNGVLLVAVAAVVVLMVHDLPRLSCFLVRPLPSVCVYGHSAC